MPAPEVVIVDDAGTEHVFPAGFDPKRAAAIVRKQTQPRDTANLSRLSALLPDPARVRQQIGSSLSQRPVFEPGMGAAMLGSQSDPAEVLQGAKDAINPLVWLKSLMDAGRLALHPSQIPDAAKAGIEGILQHPGYATGSALTAQAVPPVLRMAGPPAVRGAIRTVAAAGDVVAPDVVGLYSPLAKNWITLAQKLRDNLGKPPATRSAAAPTPRAVGKPPALNDVLTDALNAVRQGEPPQRVALPGGDTHRTPGSVPSAANARPVAPAAPSAAAPASSAPKTPVAAPSAPPRPANPVPVVAEGLRLTEDEARAFQALSAEGYQPAEILKAIQGQRAAAALAGRFGLPSDAEVATAITDRNATGRWPQDRR